MKVIISQAKSFNQKKTKIKQGGYGNLHILADFDRTLTYSSIQGVKTPSLMAILRDGHHLKSDYALHAHALFDKFHQIEIDPKISLKQKKLAMHKWWTMHDELLIKSGLRKSDLEDIAKTNKIKFRRGVGKFLDFLYKNKIPLVILSAAGCGEAIQLFFKNFNRDYANIYYVTNKFKWDKSGRAISPQKPVIHSFNKDETILKEIPDIYRMIKKRKNVILLGDSVGDLGMITGFDYANLLKVGFLNANFDQLRNEYKKNFDVILEGDGDFGFVNDLLRSLK